ncbi:MAG: mechanosensitive ion channel [Bacteroidota bacterium]|nr:mechanosensitive ion channel [Bacteroidota bacterium]
MEENLTMAEQYLDKIVNFGFEYGHQLIGGILVLIFGLWITKLITKGVGKALIRGKIDPSLVPFIKSLTNIILKILVVITVMGMIGIQMTSFIAILGAAGLAIGMALSGTLQNFAGGVIILIFKPFKVGDFIEAQGYMGTVKEISIFTTRLNTVDKKLIIIPNGSLSKNCFYFSIVTQI